MKYFVLFTIFLGSLANAQPLQDRTELTTLEDDDLFWVYDDSEGGALKKVKKSTLASSVDWNINNAPTSWDAQANPYTSQFTMKHPSGSSFFMSLFGYQAASQIALLNSGGDQGSESSSSSGDTAGSIGFYNHNSTDYTQTGQIATRVYGDPSSDDMASVMELSVNLNEGVVGTLSQQFLIDGANGNWNFRYGNEDYFQLGTNNEYTIKNPSGTAPIFNINGYGTNEFPKIYLKKANGSSASPSDVTNDEDLGGIVFHGYAGGGMEPAAGIIATTSASGTVGSGSIPTKLAITVSQDASISGADSGIFVDGGLNAVQISDDVAGYTLFEADLANEIVSINGRTLEINYDGSASFNMSSYGTTVYSSAELKSANGSIASPSATQANDTLGQLTFQGYGGTQFDVAGMIQVKADSNSNGLADGDMPGFMTIAVSADDEAAAAGAKITLGGASNQIQFIPDGSTAALSLNDADSTATFAYEIQADSIQSLSSNTDLSLEGAGTGVVHVSDSLKINNQLTSGGSFSPTATGTANITSVSDAEGTYNCVLGVCNGQFKVTFDATTTATLTTFDIALPQASNFANSYEAGGTCVYHGAGGPPTIGMISANTTDDRLTVTSYPITVTSYDLVCTFSYKQI